MVGAPWSIPLEFPIYQWIVALIRFMGIPIDVGGRLISFAFFIGCLVPLRMLFRTLGLKTETFLICAIL